MSHHVSHHRLGLAAAPPAAARPMDRKKMTQQALRWQQLLLWIALLLLANPPGMAQRKGTDAAPEKTPLDLYIEEALARQATTPTFASAGSIFFKSNVMADLSRDLRAANVDDVLTILVVERASSVTSGTTNTDRNTRARSGFDGFFGRQDPTSFFGNLVGFQGGVALDAEGSTSRQVSVSTTMSARVTHVLPNGALAIEGIKRVGINAEQQEVKVRGVIRTIDLGPGNTVTSNRITQLEVSVNGEGVVADAIKKPHFLIGLLSKFLPF